MRGHEWFWVYIVVAVLKGSSAGSAQDSTIPDSKATSAVPQSSATPPATASIASVGTMAVKTTSTPASVAPTVTVKPVAAHSSSTSGGESPSSATLTTVPHQTTTALQKMCYNVSCNSSSHCLTDKINKKQGTTCTMAQGGHCKITRKVKGGNTTIVGECVAGSCQFSNVNSQQQGQITSNCCDNNLCNKEDQLKGASARVIIAYLPWVIASLCILLHSEGK